MARKTPTFLEVLMVNNLVFSWPKPLFFHGFWGPMASHQKLGGGFQRFLMFTPIPEKDD